MSLFISSPYSITYDLWRRPEGVLLSRRLHHGRDLREPFDFLTWFEYASAHAEAFEELVGKLRETEEWSYVERQVDVRLVRDDRP
jgi:hypothetical protein